MNSTDFDSDETVTAYHEAGHAVIGYALGGQIESVQLGGEADDELPERFGDCRINWGRTRIAGQSGNSQAAIWQRQCELMTILAGPVAEMIYTGEPFHPAHYGPWQDDWQRAWIAGEELAQMPKLRTQLLENLIRDLYQRLQSDQCWAAIAAVADELIAHEFLDGDQLADTLSFWVGGP